VLLRSNFDRQWEAVPESGCWLWTGSVKESRGELRGRVMLDGRRQYAHRWAYELYKGQIPAGLQVNHKCDVSICVNPDHLYIGTQQDNVKDREARGRRGRPVGEKNPRAKITAHDASEIYASDQTNTALARRYGISSVMVGLIKRKKSWGCIHA